MTNEARQIYWYGFKLCAALKEYKQRLIADVVTGQEKVA